MSKYEVGDKVVMEITNKISVMEEPWYVLSNATSIESLSTYIEQARAEGQNEAWGLAMKLRYMDYEDKLECFGLKHDGEEKWVEIMEKYTYPEAAAKVAQWEKAKEEIKDDEDCLKCQFFEKHNDEYPCSHCCHCYTSKFKQIGGEE